MASVSETIQVSGVRCERCVMRLGGVLRRLDGIEAANANLMGQVLVTFDDEVVSREVIETALAGGGFKPLSV